MNPELYLLLPPDKQKEYKLLYPVPDVHPLILIDDKMPPGYARVGDYIIKLPSHQDKAPVYHPYSESFWSDGNYNPRQDLIKLKECWENEHQLSIKDLEELSESFKQHSREDAIKREVDYGNGIKRTVWYKGGQIVDSELSISKERYDELTAWLDEK